MSVEWMINREYQVARLLDAMEEYTRLKTMLNYGSHKFLNLEPLPEEVKKARQAVVCALDDYVEAKVKDMMP